MLKKITHMSQTALLMFWVPRVYQQWKWARLCMRPRWISKYGSLGPHIMDQRVKEVEEW